MDARGERRYAVSDPIIRWAPAVFLEALHMVYGVDTSQPPYAVRVDETDDGVSVWMPIADLTIEIHKGRQGPQDSFTWTVQNKAKPSDHDAAIMGHALEVLLEECGVLVPPETDITH
jgi:hypothetical protein